MFQVIEVHAFFLSLMVWFNFKISCEASWKRHVICVIDRNCYHYTHLFFIKTILRTTLINKPDAARNASIDDPVSTSDEEDGTKPENRNRQLF